MANRLADAVSPYLQAHASNPVDWYPWGEDAFAAARERDAPVLISIGYATCHWCHVMARESFSDPVTAEILNREYVAIKVDREEHPAVDAAYLAAASAFTRELGWPLTVFATPEGRTFYAGTYFPPRQVGRVPAFRDVLAAVAEAWRERRTTLDETAEAVGVALSKAASVSIDGGLPGRAELGAAARAIAEEEDPDHGGFGIAPKFPMAPVLGFLAGVDDDGRALAARTFARMSASPLRDRVDGGWFRYATRPDWSEPHYERMLPDNALLLDVGLELLLAGGRAAASGGRDGLEPTIDGMVGFLLGRMRLPGGGFAAAQDSESLLEGRRNEGGYYRLDADERAAVEPPQLDEKLVTGWNGLAIGALARAGELHGDGAPLEAAREAADLLLARHLRDGVLARASRAGRLSDAPAALEDVGMFARGLVRLAIATGEAAYAVAARGLIDRAMADAAAAASPAPFAVPGDAVLEARGLAVADDPAEGAAPSGLTTCGDAARLLHALGAGERYREAAERAAAHVAGVALQRPLSFGGALRLMSDLAAPLIQVVTVLPDGTAAEELAHETRWHAASVAVVVTETQAAAFADAGFELFESRGAADGEPTAYRCEGFVCALPVRTAAELAALAPY